MRREQVFWGWGEPGAGPEMSSHAADFLRGQALEPGTQLG